MTMKNTSQTDSFKMTNVKKRISWKSAISIAVPLLIIIVALSIASTWMSTPARPKKMARTQQAKLVEVMPVNYSQAEPLLQLHGEVMAAMSVKLYPQIAGRVMSINGDLAPGTLVSKGQTLASIEEADYLLAVQEAKANLGDARASYQQELGNQAVANRELNILMQQLKTELTEQQRKLILRHPQLAQAQAKIDSAKAALAEAKLNLTRTQIRAPFSGIISNKYIDQGSQLTTSTAIVDLIDTTAFWIKVALPSDYLRHLTFVNENPETGSKVNIFLGKQTKNTRSAELYKRLPELNSTTRQSQILLRVDDPLALKPENAGKAQLMVNDYVAVDIIGKPLQHVLVLDESVVHNGNQVWTYQQGKLRIHQLDVIWREQGRIIAASGVQEGDMLVTTNIANAYDGLKITTGSPAKASSIKETLSKKSDRAEARQGHKRDKPIMLREEKSLQQQESWPENLKQHKKSSGISL